ncbi:MAG: hypothetical protein HUJ76_10785, partial [Parasporobacterium sp.]|nr:hypothetical protein [Parasporobacterium sp.]
MSSLLVIGNGFDMALDCKTSYKDFFESGFYKKKRDAAHVWITNVRKLKSQITKEKNDLSEITCWDLLFCLESP